MKNKIDKSNNFDIEGTMIWLIVIGIIMVIYYQIDAIWLNPDNYSAGSMEDQYFESQGEAIRGW